MRRGIKGEESQLSMPFLDWYLVDFEVILLDLTRESRLIIDVVGKP